MTEEQEGTTNEQSFEQPFHAPVPYPFFDAVFTMMCLGLAQQPADIKATRQQISSGSSLYVMRRKNKLIGTVSLRTTVDNQTIIIIGAIDARMFQSLQAFLANTWMQMQLLIPQDPLYPSIAHIPPDEDAWNAYIEEVQSRAPHLNEVIKNKRREEPRRGASIDTWLDWRDIEAQHGNRVTLAYIAKKGNLSIDKLKKRSAERQVRALNGA